jgi:polynucleotide 5'-hydroxyl-kinase GRC3/NOL9
MRQGSFIAMPNYSTGYKMPLELLEEWKPHVDDLLASPGVTVVVGDVDSGKTSFCALLADRAVECGVTAAIVDGDMGQSEIGPPTTVGLGLVDGSIRALSDLHPQSLYFVGTTSPAGHLLVSGTAVKLLTEKAQAMGRQLVIVDTTGLISGAVGRRLKTYKIELLRPRHIVALQRATEAEHFLRFFDTWEGCTVHRLPVTPGARVKSQMLRAQRRAVRLYEYFRDSDLHQMPLEDLATSGTWLRTGDMLEPRLLKFAEKALRTPIFHGESLDRGVYLVASGDYNRRGVDELQEYFRTRNVIIVPASRYQNVVVGLLDRHLELLALGIARGIDFRAQTISLLTPLRSMSPVRSMRFGVLKIRPDGTQIGRLRPDEI